MGYSIDELAIIKAKLLKSNPTEVVALIEYIEEQLSPTSVSEESSFTLSLADTKNVRMNITSVPLEVIEAMLHFALEQLTLSRFADKAALLAGLDKVEFYTRELRYSKLEKFIFNLTAI